MAVLTYSEIQNLALDRAQANVTTDAPFSATEIARFINDAYADVWNISGGRLKTVDSATAWTSAQSGRGIIQGLLTDVEDVRHIFASTLNQSISCTTNATTTVTSAALFGSVTAGMSITGTGIPNGAFVVSVATTSSLTISIAATDSTTTARTFFTMGNGTGDVEVDRAELSEILALRASSSGYPTYLVPKKYALSRIATTTPASVNLLRLDYWPGVTGYYMNTQYVPQFTPIDSATVTTPDVDDLLSRDIALITASRMAQVIGRAELVPGIMADISTRTQAALEHKLQALLDAKQDT